MDLGINENGGGLEEGNKFGDETEEAGHSDNDCSPVYQQNIPNDKLSGRPATTWTL